MELKGYKNNKEIADNTKNKILNCLRVVLDEAKRQKLISTNPAREVELINAEYGSRIPFSEIEMYQMFPQNENELLKYGEIVHGHLIFL
ncbi:MAG: hypothetical protein K9K80_02520 [Spirochaetia bacterium]|nr:hypothetical protein [Spirochaetia bacterium]